LLVNEINYTVPGRTTTQKRKRLIFNNGDWAFFYSLTNELTNNFI